LEHFQRVWQEEFGLAQALINDPELLILDEPTTGLDPIGTRQIKDLIIELAKRGKDDFSFAAIFLPMLRTCVTESPYFMAARFRPKVMCKVSSGIPTKRKSRPVALVMRLLRK